MNTAIAIKTGCLAFSGFADAAPVICGQAVLPAQELQAISLMRSLTEVEGCTAAERGGRQWQQSGSGLARRR
jgi:hypothetical protein